MRELDELDWGERMRRNGSIPATVMPNHFPIVFITANGDEAVRPRVLAQGAVACLFKPFSDTALLEALNTALQVN